MIHNLEKNELIAFEYNTNGITEYPNTIIIYIGERADLLKNEFYSRTFKNQSSKDIFYGSVEAALNKFGTDFFKKQIVIVKV